MKRLIYILTIAVFASCGGPQTNIPDDVNYEIINEETNNMGSCNLNIRLNKKVEKAVLKDIALTLREDRKKYKKLWIAYLLPDMKPDAGAWATTHFTPELEVEILGATETEDQETSKTTDIDGEIIGKWRSEQSLMGAALILFKNPEGKLMMKIAFKDGSTMDSEIVESTQDGKTKYQNANEHDEYYILESNGNLGMYGNDGKFDEAVKIE